MHTQKFPCVSFIVYCLRKVLPSRHHKIKYKSWQNVTLLLIRWSFCRIRMWLLHRVKINKTWTKTIFIENSKVWQPCSSPVCREHNRLPPGKLDKVFPVREKALSAKVEGQVQSMQDKRNFAGDPHPKWVEATR